MTRRSILIMVAVALYTAPACSVSELLSAPHCHDASSSVLISAQSVPSASLVVCFTPLPRGWEIASVDIGHGGTTVVFHSDRAGGSAAVFHYAESCDVGGATSTPSEFEGTSRYEQIFQVEPRFTANRYYQFQGGCVTWEFDFDPDTPAAMAIELDNSLQFIDREIVNRDLRDTFVDEDL